jgi:hypothetical protein
MNELTKYYDFFIGMPRTDASSWKEQDLKIPAKDLEQALKRYYVSSSLTYSAKIALLRRVTEWVCKKKQGRTVYHFAKVAVYDENIISACVVDSRK